MKRYIKSSTNAGKYIGGELSDLPDNYWDDETAQSNRYAAQDKFITDFASNYILYRPSKSKDKYQLVCTYPGLIDDISDTLRIKDGIDVCDMGKFITVVGYYNNKQDIVCLYPVNIQKAVELAVAIDNSDFSESDTIDAEISQYAWQGQSITDVLSSWS